MAETRRCIHGRTERQVCAQCNALGTAARVMSPPADVRQAMYGALRDPKFVRTWNAVGLGHALVILFEHFAEQGITVTLAAPRSEDATPLRAAAQALVDWYEGGVKWQTARGHVDALRAALDPR